MSPFVQPYRTFEYVTVPLLQELAQGGTLECIYNVFLLLLETAR